MQSRINHDSPYSKGKPIRKIISIETIPIKAGLCGHCCVAMLSGVPLPMWFRLWKRSRIVVENIGSIGLLRNILCAEGCLYQM